MVGSVTSNEKLIARKVIQVEQALVREGISMPRAQLVEIILAEVDANPVGVFA